MMLRGQCKIFKCIHGILLKCQQLQPKLEASGQEEHEAKVIVYNSKTHFSK